MDREPPCMFRMRGLPSTFVIDSSGKVVFQHIGSAKWDAESVKEFIHSLL